MRICDICKKSYHATNKSLDVRQILIRNLRTEATIVVGNYDLCEKCAKTSAERIEDTMQGKVTI